jgi:CheY-like chemotaxis protein
VLVVEDQPDNRDLLKTVLIEMLDLTVLTASDGLEALEKADSGPDLILLDLLLPRLNGFEVVRRLKAANGTRHIPVLALTALSRPTEQEEALEAGCDGLIVKPFDTDDLVRTVAAHLNLGVESAATPAAGN